MSIHIILGRPGSGKSMYATSRVVNTLIESQQNIVTNLPLRPEILNEYVNTKYPNINTRFVERLRIMSDDEMRHFWDFRGPPTAENPNGSDEGRGVAYFLDEAHIAFNARDWATLGRSAIHYMSQHRKLGDTVWPITQACGNLDKQFRSVAEDYTVLRNEYTAKLGIFRGMGRFVRKSYYSEPQPNAEPFETATFSIDTKGIAACYDTAKGIGVHGSKADIGRRAKGIPIWWIFPAMGLGACSIVFIPYLMGKGAAKFISSGAVGKVAGGVNAARAAANPVPVVTPPPVVKVPPSEPEKASEKEHGPEVRHKKTEKELPQVTGYLVRGSRFTVQLADGQQVQDTDGRLGGYRRGRVLIDGVWVTPHRWELPGEAGKILHTIYKRSVDGELIPVTVEVQSSSDGGTNNNQPQKQNDNDKDPPQERRDNRDDPDAGQTAHSSDVGTGKTIRLPRGVPPRNSDGVHQSQPRPQAGASAVRH